MAETPIEWTDWSANPIRARNKATGGVGHYCQKVSPGCANCYAERLQPRFQNKIKYNAASINAVDLYLELEVLHQVLGRRKPTRIFWCDMTDLFGEWVRPEWIDLCLGVMALTKQHTHLVLTKRPDRAVDYFFADEEEMRQRVSGALGTLLDGAWIWGPGQRWRGQIEKMVSAFMGIDCDDDGGEFYPDDPLPLPSVWLGTSVEDQERADQRRLPLAELDSRGWHTWVSSEPRIGPIQWTGWEFIKWMVTGGESGPGSRVFHVEWARRDRDWCAANRIAWFLKQLGAQHEGTWLPDDGHANKRLRLGTFRLKHKKGGNMAEWPEDLRVRELPQVAEAFANPD